METAQKKMWSEWGHLCSKLRNINQINEDFQTVYAVGNVTAISQPPLVITPKIAIEAPINLQTLDELEKPKNSSSTACKNETQYKHQFEIL